MNGVDNHTVIAPVREVVARKLDGHFVLVDTAADEGGAYDDLFELNDTGSAIWECIDGVASIAAIAELLEAQSNGTGDELQSDVRQFIGELLETGWVEVVDR